METSRRRFVKTSCLGALCFCGFGRLLGANTPALEDTEEASNKSECNSRRITTSFIDKVSFDSSF